ncbi:MAG TPA: SDR family oxidoreductase [Planctomycetota bacterium]|nr:SDR family oxidoreductase [Planctomycetota bacterium]
MSRGRNKDPFRLDGRIALVTGASRGLGQAIALEFARRGADLALVARGAGALRRAAAAARRLGVRAECFPADLALPDSLGSVFDAVVRGLGAPTVLVNAAGTTFRGPSEAVPLADWRRVQAVNLESALVLSQCFVRALEGARRGACRGKIVNICSLLSARARATIAAYTASKTGLLGLTRTLAVEWAARGINVNAIGPGYFETEMTAPLVADAKFRAWVESRAPMGRWGRPADLTGAAVYLASPASDFVTGQILYVDGGWTAGL